MYTTCRTKMEPFSPESYLQKVSQGVLYNENYTMMDELSTSTTTTTTAIRASRNTLLYINYIHKVIDRYIYLVVFHHRLSSPKERHPNGLVGAKTIDAMKLAGPMQGIVLDPVYTAKAFAGMLHKSRTGEIQRGKPRPVRAYRGPSLFRVPTVSHLDLSSKL